MVEVMFGMVWTATTMVYVLVTAAVTDSFVFPSVGLGVLVIIGGYVWKFTRRADKVMLRTLRSVTAERNYHRDDASWWQEYALTGKAPDMPRPKMSEYLPEETPDNGS